MENVHLVVYGNYNHSYYMTIQQISIPSIKYLIYNHMNLAYSLTSYYIQKKKN